MRILGLDPGSRLLGYGVLEREGTGWRRLASGVLRLPVKDPIPQRLVTAYQAVREIVQTHRPEHVAIEECFVAHSPRSALVLGQVRGVLLLAAQIEQTTLHEFAPRAVKLAAVGNGGASKEQVQAMIPRLLHDCRTGLSADEADALAVAWCCANQLRNVRVISGTVGWRGAVGR